MAAAWDRQVTEDAKAFFAFCIYRDIGRKRSVDEAYRQANPEKPGQRANGDWYGWCTKNNWINRAKMFDEFISSRKKEAVIEHEKALSNALSEERKGHKKMEAELSLMGLKKAKEILEAPLFTPEIIEEKDGKTIIIKERRLPAPMIFAACQLFKISSQIGRQALGIAEDDGKDVTFEEFRQLFFQTKYLAAKMMPVGALPSPPANPDAKPDLNLGGADVGDKSKSANGNGNGYEIMKPDRERP